MALYDITAANRQAVQSGLALGAQMFSNDLRMQQFKSDEALRRIQEQQMAQQMAFQLQQHNMMVDQQAEMTKAMAQVQLESQPTVQMPVVGPATPEGGDMGTTAVPNPNYVPLDQSLMRNVLPVIAKYRPQEADNFVANVAMLPYRQAEAERQRALAAKDFAAAQAGPKPLSTIGKMQADRATAMARGDFDAVKEIDAAILKQHADAASEVGKMVEEHKRLTGKDFTPEEVDDLYKIKAGLKPRAAVVQPLTFSQFANKNLQFYMDNKTHFDAKTQKLRRPASTEEAMADLKASYDSMQDHIKGMPSPAAAGGGDTQAAPEADPVLQVKDRTGKIWPIRKSKVEEALKRDPTLIVIDPNAKG